MRKYALTVLGVVALLALVASGAAWANMMHGEQVKVSLGTIPSVKTSASGDAVFELSKDGKTIHYKLTLKKIDNATMAHVHAVGDNGTPAEILVWIYPNERYGAFPPGGKLFRNAGGRGHHRRQTLGTDEGRNRQGPVREDRVRDGRRRDPHETERGGRVVGRPQGGKEGQDGNEDAVRLGVLTVHPSRGTAARQGLTASGRGPVSFAVHPSPRVRVPPPAPWQYSDFGLATGYPRIPKRQGTIGCERELGGHAMRPGCATNFDPLLIKDSRSA